MTLEDAGTLLARFCIAGPALYIALTMLMHPRSMVRIMRDFTSMVQDFERRVLGQHPQSVFDDEVSMGTLRAIRVVGAIFVVWALLPLTGLLG